MTIWAPFAIGANGAFVSCHSIMPPSPDSWLKFGLEAGADYGYILPMDVVCGNFQWSTEKDALNLKKHGICFRDALAVFQDDNRIDFYDPDSSLHMEDRFKTIGRIRGILVIIVIHTERKGAIRLISARKATRNEEILYYAGN